ncbi:hypothetical protein DRO64_05075 [Candidatus Bathyarchaeota archaeon]|nr:MAG: hypothetical protein DRO64_05075 [Candidatus Bathyarchaeota archaeon]
MEFSVVMPVHNEERYLPYSLPSIFKLDPSEVILIFDRCTDRSMEIAEKISQRFNFVERTIFVEMNDPSPEWNFRVAFLRRYGFKMAKNDVILNTDADCILDTKIRKYLPLIGRDNIALISFGRRTYPPTIQDTITTIASLLLPKIGFTGVYAFSKRAWLETENEASVKKIIRAEDTHLHLSISKKYKTLFIRTKTIHLRPEESSLRHYIKGITYWTVKRNPVWKAVMHSFIYLRPMLLVGYLHARFGRHRLRACNNPS